MKNLFKRLLPVLIGISMIFTMGIKTISIDNSILVDNKEEEVLEASPVDLKEEESNKKDLEIVGTNEGKIGETESPQQPVGSTESKEEKIEKLEQEDPKQEVKDSEEKPIELEEDKKKVSDKDLKEDVKEEPEDEIEDIEDLEEENKPPELEKLKLVLEGTSIMIEDSIVLGSAKVNSANNYMEVTGGDGDYSYEWRILGDEDFFSQDRNPIVSPTSTTNYQLIVRDSSGSEALESIMVIVEKGSIEITNEIEGLSFRDTNRKFDVLINGPDERLYTLSLRNGESKTLENLKEGTYTVSTIVPMNYKLLGITNKNITVSLGNTDHKTTIKNIRTNYSWFYSESYY